MDKWQTFGHDSVKNILNKQLSLNTFAHAYLFSGPDGVGKKTLALEFAAKVLNTENVFNHPDFQILDAQGEITAELMQNFIRPLGFKPFVGSKKIAVINNVQNFNQHSANKLLKTLEEPSQSSIIILVANGSSPLPTIVSRCQVFNFSLFSDSELASFAEQQKIIFRAEQVELSFGSSSSFLSFVQNADIFDEAVKSKNNFLDLKKNSLGKRILEIASLAEIEVPALKKLLTGWLFLELKSLPEQPKNFFSVRAIMEALENLEKNFNKKLVLQGLMRKL